MNSLAEVLGAVLTYTDLKIESTPLDEDNLVPQLKIQLEKELELRLFCANDALTASEPSESQGDMSSVYYFVARYPESISAPLSQQLGPLLEVFNLLLPIGMLEMHTHDGLFFRHILLTEDAILDGLLALDIIRALRGFLPPVFSWLKQVILQADLMSTELQSEIHRDFKSILDILPVIEPVLSHFPQKPKAEWQNYLQHHVTPALLAGSGAALILTSILVPTLNTLAILGILGSVMAYWWRQRSLRFQESQKEQKELRFFWQLLEVEAIKLAYQGHSLDLHKQSVSEKLTELSNQSVNYPSDILRLRSQILCLKQIQSHLIQRSTQLKHKREELENNRAHLHLQRRALMPMAVSSSKIVALELEETGSASEDMLMQNLVVTLDYLGFPVRVLSEDHSPLVLVYVRPDLPPMALRWLPQWHQALEYPCHSWLLCFDLALNVSVSESLWPRVAELLRMFNRFLPLGSLMYDRKLQRVVLRYRFVRLRGDLSTMLVMEILEVMASFAERLQKRLYECRDANKHLERILHETELDFQSLQS